ncbi:MbtH family protein [Hartmannibacter diazotrophicus]|uniref:MbtH family protein n=1 Tax=Hartmannibacter diazotrophicus TaxID=1482074 RepID=UPI0012FD4945|nr:MbtH family NRPS accessory protein [Hartmannibacter diazotrophicus]
MIDQGTTICCIEVIDMTKPAPSQQSANSGLNGTMEPIWRVVRNHQGCYSVWRCDRSIPAGWAAISEAQDRPSCLAAIDQIWRDPRPENLKHHQRQFPSPHR